MMNSNVNANSANGKSNKFKPYRNRPGKRQGLLELFSFLLLLAAVPAFLGGVFSIFISIATFALGIIGLFAWTRRHAKFFILLAILVIAACIVNIILRGTFHAQCMPFYEYRNNFGSVVAGGATGSSSNSTSNTTNVAPVVPVAPVTGSNDTTSNDTLAERDNNNNNNNNNDSYNNNGTKAFIGAAGGANETAINGNGNSYDNSIWCGNNYIVFITHAIIIGLAAAALFFALSALNPRNKTPVTARTTETASTHTRTVATEQY